jgi:hypothetical protein
MVFVLQLCGYAVVHVVQVLQVMQVMQVVKSSIGHARLA